MGAGFEPCAFWRQTPRMAQVAIGARMRADDQDRMRLAWHTAAFGRVKKLPSLDKLTAVKPQARKAQTAAQMMRAMDLWMSVIGD